MEVKAKIIVGDSRVMEEISNDSIDLIITSPPYWQIKDYGNDKQIGYNQSLSEYYNDLYRVWKECHCVIKPGRRLCINIGDIFTQTSVYGRHKVIPIHAKYISQCENIGFDYMGSIIWQKRTTINSTGGASVLGSYPYPSNGLVEYNYEYIAIFKKLGKSEIPSIDVKEISKIKKEEWMEYFSSPWNIAGVKQGDHPAMFPDEIPKRLIKMFSFQGETVLDPFLGSGTTAKMAIELDRNTIGYEISEKFLPIIKKKLSHFKIQFSKNFSLVVEKQKSITPT